MLWLFAFTVFASATLLFSVEPLYTRQLLPMLGGSPAVWNATVTFFQAILLIGYGYAHFITTRLSLSRQLLVHFFVLICPLFVLPVVISDRIPLVGAFPVLWIFQLMAVTVGLPFFVLSATAPLIQKWFTYIGHSRSADPYFLYVASNAGSLVALLSYPFIIEPNLGLKRQGIWWMYGYWVLAVLVGACLYLVWSKRNNFKVQYSRSEEAALSSSRKTVVNWPQRLRWIFYAFIPSSLLLGVTTFISSEVAPMPLLWVVPLALYLLTFVLAFAQRQFLRVTLLKRLQTVCLIVVVMLINMRAIQPLAPIILIHLLSFFVSALLCHTVLAMSRPAVDHLTEFYLWICVGGVLGGLFNSLVAPIIFSSVAEYPLAIVLTCFVVGGGLESIGSKVRLADWVFPLILFAISVSLAISAAVEPSAIMFALVFGAPAIICYCFSGRPFRFGLGVAGLLIAGAFYKGPAGQLLYAERTFFGVNRVTRDEKGGFNMLFHGRTLHGMQSLDPARGHEPLTYYHRTGPIGQILETYYTKPTARVAAVGLGAGALASYAHRGQAWTFYEIDPAVVRIARDPRYFRYLSDSEVHAEVRLGDARLTLATAPDLAYDLIVLDAYNSDAIPVHLVTREALGLYLRKLAAHGRLAFHISNLHLSLEPVLANLAKDFGLVALLCDDTAISDEEAASGKSPSQWIVMAKSAADLTLLSAGHRWESARPDPTIRLWTDDYSSIWSIFLWQ